MEAVSEIAAGAPFMWLMTPMGIFAIVGLAGFVLSGIPARIILVVETTLASTPQRQRPGPLPATQRDSMAPDVVYLERAA